jgi:hypothetical protein
MPMSALVCLITRHRWGAGFCDRCKTPCRHPIVVCDPNADHAICLDCGAKLLNPDRFSRSA